MALLSGFASTTRPAYQKLTGRVVDDAHLLTSGEKAALVHQLEGIQDKKKVQFAVVTTPSLANLSIDTYALRLFNQWGLGDKLRNDGLMLLVAPRERKVRIEVGRGLEQRLPNPLCAAIVQRMLPSFSEGKFARGIQIGVDALETSLDSEVKKAA